MGDAERSGEGGRPPAAAHFLFEALGNRRMSDAHNAAYGLKTGRLIFPSRAGEGQYDIGNLEHVAEVCEMAAVRQWGEAGGGGSAPGMRHGQAETSLEDLCRWCFGLLEACPVPGHPAAKFSHVLRLFAYAYMGDRWEAMKRYIRERGDSLKLRDGADGETYEEAAKDGGWEFTVMSEVHDALLLLVGKNSAEDLRRCGKIIDNASRRA